MKIVIDAFESVYYIKSGVSVGMKKEGRDTLSYECFLQ